MMKLDPSELVSSSDIADILGVVPSAITNWRARDLGFPSPVAVVGRGRTLLFLREDVIRWYVARQRGDLAGSIERAQRTLDTMKRIQKEAGVGKR